TSGVPGREADPPRLQLTGAGSACPASALFLPASRQKPRHAKHSNFVQILARLNSHAIGFVGGAPWHKKTAPTQGAVFMMPSCYCCICAAWKA
ncbi:MAG: hypothetical protein ACRC1O_17020, partial [Ralstonia mannitolilytica]